MANITSVTVAFGNGVKREDFGPVKKAEVSITMAVADDDDGEAVVGYASNLAMVKVAEMLSAPKPEVAAAPAAEQAAEGNGPPPRRTRGPNKPKEETPVGAKTEPTAATAEQEKSSEESPATAVASTPTTEEQEDEWAAAPEDTPVSDQEILSATSKKAGELGARDPIVRLIATFATRTEGAPFKVQEIPQSQRRDYLAKLAALTT